MLTLPGGTEITMAPEAKMLRKWMFALMFLTAPGTLAVARDAKTLITNVSKAMGYDQLKSIEYSGSGLEGTALGQAQSATAGWPKFTLKRFSRYIDLNAGTSQQTAMRSRPADPTGQLAGGGGLAAVPESEQTTVINANASWAQKLDVSLSPPAFLKLASAASNAPAKSQSMNGKKYRVISFPWMRKRLPVFRTRSAATLMTTIWSTRSRRRSKNRISSATWWSSRVFPDTKTSEA